MSGHVCGQQCWYIAKRRGRMVRGRNRCTGAWEPHWWREDVYPYVPEGHSKRYDYYLCVPSDA